MTQKNRTDLKSDIDSDIANNIAGDITAADVRTMMENLADSSFNILSDVPITVAQGGTGQITANAALNALLPSQATASGQVLGSDGTNAAWQPVVAPSGSSGAIQYNSGGAFGGSQITSDGTGLLQAANWQINDDGSASFGGGNAAISNSGQLALGVNSVPNSNLSMYLQNGSGGGMSSFPYEVAALVRDGDTKFGVYTSASSGAGSSVVLGFTNQTDSFGYYPGFEFQMATPNGDPGNNFIRYNYLGRNSGGNVQAANIDLLNIYGDGAVVIDGSVSGGYSSATPRLLVNTSTWDSLSTLQVAGKISVDSGDITTDGSGNITANGFIKSGGTSSQFLKADGSTDSSSYFILPSLTSGSVLFSNGSTISQDNANFFYNSSTHHLGLGTTSPNELLEVNGNIRFTNSSAGGATNTIKVTNNTAGNGDGITVQAGNGVASSTGNRGGDLTFTPGNAGNLTASGFAGISQRGGAMSMTSGTGASATVAGTDNQGGNGGSASFMAGNGGSAGNATNSVQGGNGGSGTIQGGTGGAATSNTASSSPNAAGGGGQANLIGGTGGSGTAGPSDGGFGGQVNITGSPGGPAGTGRTGGFGSQILMTGGTGGAATTGSGANTGGAGSLITIKTGNGGNATTTGSLAAVTSGNGGVFTLTAGNGGTVTGAGGTRTAGTAGTLNFTAGNGGTGSGTGTLVGAAGGNISFTGGNGTSTTGATNAGGSLYFLPGAGSPSGMTGNIFLGINSSGTARGLVSVGQSSPTALLDVAAATTSNASLRIRSGTAPTSPNDGDMWYDGTNLKFCVAGTTKTVTLV